MVGSPRPLFSLAPLEILRLSRLFSLSLCSMWLLTRVLTILLRSRSWATFFLLFVYVWDKRHFCGMACRLLKKIEIRLLFQIYDLRWPHVTSRLLFFETRRQERHFEIQFIIFQKSPKFDLFFGFLTQSDLYWHWDTFYQKADVESVILIYNLTPFNKVRILTLNDPKFVIWPQTRIFYLEIIFRFHWSF